MYSFNIIDDEWKQIVEWEEKHNKECPIILKYNRTDYETGEQIGTPYGAIGGGRTYCFTPTSIGIFITVKCCCGASFDCDSNL